MLFPRAGSRFRLISFALLVLAACLVLPDLLGSPWSAALAADGPQGTNLLAGLRPIDSAGTGQPERITDGVIARPGDFWRTNLTSTLRDRSAHVIYDLGSVVSIQAALIQGDANDMYTLSVSDDGVTYRPLWTAGPVRGAGMQTRESRDLQGQGRYVKLSARGGDGRYTVAEIAIASTTSGWPPSMVVEKGQPPEKAAELRMQVFAAAAILFLLLNHRKAAPWVKALVIVPIALALYLGIQLAEMWPLDEPELTLLRAVIAAIAAVALFRHYFPGKDSEPDKRWTTAVLAVLAIVSVMSFYHFGHPQFRDESKGRQTLVHPWDMRVYFPVVKYFDELRFDGLYLASVAAYLDNNPSVEPKDIANVRLRDLNNNEMKQAGDVMEQIQGIRARFTPERWEQFRKDMRYFQDVMGSGGYLSSLRDHGGNATPVWILTAYLFWAAVPANELTLSLTALIDPVLLIAMLIVVGRTFGWRVMLTCAIIFGTTDLSRFGTNLMGSTLRLDWMVAMGFGACALYTKRWILGGALLAYAGLIRGFPGMAAIFLAAPVAMWIVDHLREHKKLPTLRQLREIHMPFLKATAGGLGAVIVLVALSSAVFGYQNSWGNWIYKISIHQNKPNVNHVGLRNIMSFESDKTGRDVLRPEMDEPWTIWQQTQLAALERRKPVYYAAILLFTGLAVAATRGRKLHQAAMLGSMMIPVYFYPANYYCHYVFLLPLLAVDRKETSDKLYGWVAIALVAMSTALFFTLEERQVDVRYTLQSDVILAGYLLVLAPMAYFAWRKPRQAVASAVGPGGESSEEVPAQPAAQAEGTPKKRKKKRADRAEPDAASEAQREAGSPDEGRRPDADPDPGEDRGGTPRDSGT